MAIPLFAEIEKLIVEHGSAAVLKEHLALLQTKLSLLKDEFEKLELVNADLKQKVFELEARLTSSLPIADFVEERGAFFKRRTGGGYHNAVYCPNCKISTSPFPPGESFNCRCGWFSSFTERELKEIINGLPT